MSDHPEPDATEKSLADRRQFLAAAGRFAVVVPPAMTLMLSTSMSSSAIAQSISLGGGDDDNDALALLPLPFLAALGGPGAPAAALPLVAGAPAAAPGPVFAAAPMAAPPVQTRVAPAPKAAKKTFSGTPIQRAGERG